MLDATASEQDRHNRPPVSSTGNALLPTGSSEPPQIREYLNGMLDE